MADIAKINVNGETYNLKDGRLPDASEDTTEFLRGDGVWAPVTYASNDVEDNDTYMTVNGGSGLAAVLARNVAECEDQVDGFKDMVDGVYDALAAADIRALNGPNMLAKLQPEGVSINVPSSDVIEETLTVPIEDATAAAAALSFTVTNANITADYVLHGIKSSNYDVVWSSMVTGTAGAGSMSISIAARPDAHSAAVTVTVYLCTVQAAVLPYGEISRHYASGKPWLDSTKNAAYTGHEADEISERIVALSSADVVTEEDGASYSTAAQFTVANTTGSGYNNFDRFIWNYGTVEAHVVDGKSYGPYGLLDMVEGETYTFSCWARIVSGTQARLVMGYGTDEWGNHYYSSETMKYYDITNTTWQRIVYTFVYRANVSSYSYVTFLPRVWAGVCRYADGVVQMCGFRLVHGGLYGNNTVDTLAAQVADVHTSAEQMQAFFTSIAPVESGDTASTNYAASALVLWKGRLYKTSAAVASGATWAVGTNLTATTLAAELAALAT